MPEGPEIRIQADRLAAALVGRTIESLFFFHDKLKPYERVLAGRVVRAVEARAKALLIRFDNRLNIYSHNQLYGKWFVRKRDDAPKTRRSLRLALHTAQSSALLYSASEIDTLHNDALLEHPFLKRLGPDLLDSDTRVADVAARLENPRFRRRQLAALLLDQSFLSGPGNYLRSEILFHAGISPWLRPMDLSATQRRVLADSALLMARRAYETRGVTNDPEIAARLRAQKVPRHAYRHYAFNRGGKPCHRCQTTIEKVSLGSRRLYFCPQCQGS